MSPAPARFTETALARLAPAERRYTVFDPTLPAFGLRVEPTGVRTFQLSYRVGGRLRMATLGRLGVVTLDQARRRARIMLGLVNDGQDPLMARDAARRAVSVRTAAERWLKEHVKPRRKPTTLRLYELAEGHISTTLGSLPVAQLTTADVTRLHSRLKATPYLANRVLASLSSLVTWCERQGLRAAGQNPCRGVEKYAERGHDRYLTTAEYARLGRALRDAERKGTVGRPALAAIRLLLLTGCRPSEILTLEWTAVDLKAGLLRLADSKTGEKVVHLPPDAARLLKRWPRHVGSSFVFPGNGRGERPGEHLVNLAKPWMHLRKAARLDDVRLYDACRHSFASVAISKHGHALSVVGELLGHSQAATTKRYTHLHDEAARTAVRSIGETIARALARPVSA
jgi:integrase